MHDGIGYVVNQGDDTISGFRYARGGQLSELTSSTRALTSNPAGGITDVAQISFTPDGSRLLVTEKASNTLESFRVYSGGRTAPATAQIAAGVTPYGFGFDTHGNAIVPEAGSGAVSSYAFGTKGVNVISASVPDTQAAACWLVVAPTAVAADTIQGGTDTTVSANGRALYVRLPGGLISSWAIGRNGSLRDLGTTQGAVAFGSAGLAAG